MYIPVGAQVLALLDLSPTAHVINHAVIDRLGNKVGISRAMKAWLVFYPSDCSGTKTVLCNLRL